MLIFRCKMKYVSLKHAQWQILMNDFDTREMKIQHWQLKAYSHRNIYAGGSFHHGR